MGLSSRDAEGMGSQRPQPYYLDQCRIALAVDHSGRAYRGLNPDDISVLFSLDVGQDFMPELYIGGMFKRDRAGRIVGWGNAFVVEEAFRKLLGTEVELNDDNSIPRAWLEDVVGREIVRLRYCYGRQRKDPARLGYGDYNRIEVVGPDGLKNAMARLEKTFLEDVERGFPSDYRPDALERRSERRRGRGRGEAEAYEAPVRSAPPPSPEEYMMPGNGRYGDDEPWQPPGQETPF